jgi:hypothetical protein
MLWDHSRVLNGHLPSSELNNLSAKADMLVIETRFLHSVTHAYTELLKELENWFEERRACIAGHDTALPSREIEMEETPSNVRSDMQQPLKEVGRKSETFIVEHSPQVNPSYWF